MHDRQPTPGQEGRMLITPENGAPAYYAKVQMADNPLDEGTPLNTATLLKHQTAAMFGLGADSVPDDVYAWLGKYNQHWWAKHAYTKPSYSVSDEVDAGGREVNSNQKLTVQYSAAVQVSHSGEVSLVNPTTKTLSSSSATNTFFKSIVGRFATSEFVYDNAGSPNRKEVVCRVEGSSTSGTFVYPQFRRLTGIPGAIGALLGYEIADTIDAYPGNGLQGDMWYKFRGVPFDRTAEAAKIVVSSYYGTGTYGESSPNILTFERMPLFVYVLSYKTSQPDRGGTYNNNMLFVPNMPTEYTNNVAFGETNNNYGYAAGKRNEDGTVIEWYNSGGADSQLNEAGVRYDVIAFYD